MRRSRRQARRLAAGLAGVAAALAACSPGAEPAPEPVVDLPAAAGRLRVTAWGPGAGEPAGPQLTRLVQGDRYAGFSDTDLRGFLDGGFLWGWNQPVQIHVRAGRRSRSARFGEHELFRVVQRWADLPLPAGAHVERARLDLSVEYGPAAPRRLYLYEVREDFDLGPGGHGGRENNLPLPGETWWNERDFAGRAWRLPGLGQADDAEGDTAAEPLAEALYRPDAALLRFESERLAALVERCASRGAPLLLLLKASDESEDLPAGPVAFYSGEYGDSRTAVRRPVLEIAWEHPPARVALERDVLLEHGRRLELPPLALPPGTQRYRIEFAATEAGADAFVEVAEPGRDWQRAPLAPVAGQGPLRLRVTAAHAPVALGADFEATLRDTWVISAPPEEQVLGYRFRAPSGRVHRAVAEYLGDHRWGVRFRPRELGRWSYRFEHSFAEQPLHGPETPFDVLALDPDAVLAEIDRRAELLEDSGRPESEHELRAEYVQLARLERAGVTLLGPEDLHGPAGAPFRDALDRLRAALQEPLPEEHGFVPGERRAWSQTLQRR